MNILTSLLKQDNMKIIKIIILLLLINTITSNASAQLNNTKWKGTFNIPSPTECYFEFINDTCYVKYYTDTKQNNGAEDHLPIEISFYKIIDNSTMTLKKIEGGSPCTDDIIGKYKFVIKDQQLSISVIEDNCGPRAMAIPSEPLTKFE